LSQLLERLMNEKFMLLCLHESLLEKIEITVSHYILRLSKLKLERKENTKH